MSQLNSYDIPTSVHYPLPLNKQPAFATEDFKLDVSSLVSEKVMSLPMHPYLSESDQNNVVKKCSEIIKGKV